MSERLYPSIPDATDFDLDDEPRATFEWATFKAGQKGNDRLVAAEELLRMCVIAAHYARRAATAERRLADAEQLLTKASEGHVLIWDTLSAMRVFLSSLSSNRKDGI